MIATILSRKSVSAVAIGLMLLVPMAATAQDETESFAPATLVVTSAEGTEKEYVVNDVSVYASTSPAYDDVPATTSLSLSLTAISPLDADLLAWASQAADTAGSVRDLTIVTKIAGTDGTETETSYVITHAHVTSFSSSFSIYAAPSVSLSLEAGTLTVDGVAMN